MRKIKIRAWDDVAQKMSYGEIELFDNMLSFRFNHFETEKSIFMLWSTCQDTDGKDIYADDILEAIDSKENVCRTIVEFEDGVFCVGKWYLKEPVSIEHFNYDGEWKEIEVNIDDYERLDIVLQHHLDFRVVGNKHEHPYLAVDEDE
jgi:hypothetical protein